MGTAGVVRWAVATAIGIGAGAGLLGSTGADLAYASPTPDPRALPRTTPAPAPDPGAPQPAARPLPSAAEATPFPTAGTDQTPAPVGPPPSTVRPPSPSTPVQPQASAAPSPGQPPGSASLSPSPAPSPADQTPTPTSDANPSAADRGNAAAAVEPVADDRLYVVVVSRCGDDRAAAMEVSLSLLIEEDLALTYVVTDDDGVTRTGAVTLSAEDEGAEFAVDGLPVGSYHLDLFAEGGGEPITVQEFEVLRCLVTDVQCEQLTLTNPATNPAVGVFYAEGPDEGEFQDFDLEPGQSRVLRTDQGLIQWGAGALLRGAGENFAVAGAGEGESADGGTPVPTDCGSASPSPRADPTPAVSSPDSSPDSGPDVGLADTGATPYAQAALVLATALIVAGGAVLLRRRVRPTR